MEYTYNYSQRLEILESIGFKQKKGHITNGKYSFLYHQFDTSYMTDNDFEEFVNIVKSEIS